MTEEHFMSIHTHDDVVHSRMVQRDQGSGVSKLLCRRPETIAEIRQLSDPFAQSLARIAERTAAMGGTDERDARIAKLEADVARFEKTVADYGTLIQVMLSDLINVSRLCQNVKLERDMLAKRIQELLREAAEPEASGDVSPILAAIGVHQKQGVR